MRPPHHHQNRQPLPMSCNPHTQHCKMISPKVGITRRSNTGSPPSTPPSRKPPMRSCACCKRVKSLLSSSRTQPGQSFADPELATACECGGSHRLLTRYPRPAATQPHQPQPPVPLTPSTLRADPPHPIHRPRRSHLCHWPYPHHAPFRVSFQHPSLTTMAQPTLPAPHPAPHIPLPQLPLLQFSLHQAPFQS